MNNMELIFKFCLRFIHKFINSQTAPPIDSNHTLNFNPLL